MFFKVDGNNIHVYFENTDFFGAHYNQIDRTIAIMNRGLNKLLLQENLSEKNYGYAIFTFPELKNKSEIEIASTNNIIDKISSRIHIVFMD